MRGANYFFDYSEDIYLRLLWNPDLGDLVKYPPKGRKQQKNYLPISFIMLTWLKSVYFKKQEKLPFTIEFGSKERHFVLKQKGQKKKVGVRFQSQGDACTYLSRFWLPPCPLLDTIRRTIKTEFNCYVLCMTALFTARHPSVPFSSPRWNQAKEVN